MKKINLLIESNSLLTCEEDIENIKFLYQIVNENRNSFFYILKHEDKKCLLEWLNSKTPLLNTGDFEYSIGTKCFWVFNGITDFPKCERDGCSNKIGIHKNCGIGGYDTTHCSNRCKTLDPKVQNKIIKTVKLRYGDECSWTSTPSSREKASKTSLERFGYDNPSKSPIIIAKIADTIAKNHDGDPNYRNYEKAVETKRKMYNGKGVNGDAISKTLRNRSKEEKEIHLQRIKDSKLKNHGDPNWNNRKKGVETLRKKNNGNYESDETKEKKKKTNLEHCGYDCNFKDPAWQEKARQTRLETTGYEYPAQDPKIQEKIKNTKQKRFGQPCSPSHHYTYDEKSFDSSYELAMYIWLKDNGIHFEYSCTTYFDYIDKNGKSHVYCPDFKIGNSIVEIKGQQFIDENGKLTVPYKGKNKQDSQLLIDVAQAKHECMKLNNVKMLTLKDIDKQLKYCEEKFNDKKWYKMFMK